MEQSKSPEEAEVRLLAIRAGIRNGTLPPEGCAKMLFNEVQSLSQQVSNGVMVAITMDGTELSFLELTALSLDEDAARYAMFGDTVRSIGSKVLAVKYRQMIEFAKREKDEQKN